MLTIPPHVRVFVSTEPFDMRGSYDSMMGRARRWGLEPTDGSLYVFFSRNRIHAAVLWFDGSGWRILKKRLVKGTFQQLPDLVPGVERVTVDSRVLASLLDGIDLRAPKRRWFRQGSRAAS